VNDAAEALNKIRSYTASLKRGGHTPHNLLTDMQPWVNVYFSDIGHPCYDQLTPVKKTIRQLVEFTCFSEVNRSPGAGFSIGSWGSFWLGQDCSEAD